MLCRRLPLQWLLCDLGILVRAKEYGEGSLPARQPHSNAYGCVRGVLHVGTKNGRTARACRTQNHD